MNNQVSEYIENAPLEQKEIMNILRHLIHQNIQDVVEDFKWNRPIFKTTKEFAYFLANKNYLTLGFTKNFEKLDDPNKILEGTGKTMRHIKLKKTSDIDIELIKKWFITATTD